jgi:hypothetical protein
MKTVVTAFLSILMLFGTSQADTVVYDARSDFDSLNDGAAPYYKDRRQDALAIDASEEDYREVFARASTTFTGASGIYDVTITALGEEDGECEYRFLVDGVVVGTAVNQATDTDYELQQHTFTDISIPSGAEISVESNALTNGLIPEGNGTAYARGRWRTLTLESTSLASAVDLSLEASANAATVNSDYTVSVTVTNNSNDETATAPVVELTVPAETTVSHDGSCTTDNGSLNCALAELSAGESRTLEFVANTNRADAVSFTGTVSADQPDNNTSNNTDSVNVTVTEAMAASVDLSLAVSSDTAVVNAGQSVAIAMTIQNESTENTATAPVAGAALPPGLTFATGNDCTADGQAVNCALPELTPGQRASVTFSATAVQPGDLTLVASVSANEPESSAANNEVLYNITVVENRANNGSTGDNGDNVNVEASGGGAMGQGAMLLLLLCARRLRKQAPV